MKKKMCGCGCKNWCAGACAAHYQNVCDVHAGAAKNPRTLKVCRTVHTVTVKEDFPPNFCHSELLLY